MGKVTGFLEIDRADRRYAPASDRIRHYREFVLPLSEEATRNQAARCMNCGIPYCHIGCPVNNQIPDWNDLAYRGDWARSRAQPALDQQLSRVHRPRLPGAVRSVLHAQHPGHAGHDQNDRMRDYRPSLRRRLGGAGARSPARPARRSRSLGLAPRVSLARSSSRAPAMTSMSTRRTPKPAASCATAFLTSSWRSATSTVASSRWRPKASCFTMMPTSA